MFTVQQWKVTNNNTVVFTYDCSVYGSFTEEITLPVTINRDDTLAALFDVMAHYLGVSYYKLVACGHITSNLYLSKTAQQSVQKLYTEGLGEFYVRNNLPYPPKLTFDFKDRKEFRTPTHLNETTATVAFGGGKDSHVTIALLDKINIKLDIVSVVLADRIRDTLQRLSHKDITFIKRKIDPKLISLVKESKGYNGHIPITAINSIILSAYSYLVGNRFVIFSNERGASVPTLHHDGHAVNHQYSKSYEFESLFRNVLNEICGDNVQYFSLLRPFSELWIAKTLAHTATNAHAIFSSCNRNFVFEGKNKLPTDQRWCGKCSKCVYTAIIIAPHITQEKFIEIFGNNILDNPDNESIARDLCGIGTAKPWECVGDFADTAASLYAIRDKKYDLPKILAHDLKKKYGANILIKRLDNEITSRSDHFLPNQFQTILTDH